MIYVPPRETSADHEKKEWPAPKQGKAIIHMSTHTQGHEPSGVHPAPAATTAAASMEFTGVTKMVIGVVTTVLTVLGGYSVKATSDTEASVVDATIKQAQVNETLLLVIRGQHDPVTGEVEKPGLFTEIRELRKANGELTAALHQLTVEIRKVKAYTVPEPPEPEP